MLITGGKALKKMLITGGKALKRLGFTPEYRTLSNSEYR